MNPSIPILMYHQVSSLVHPKFYKFTVETSAFSAQMRVLKTLGFNPITLDHLIRKRDMNEKLPSNPIIITFDDMLEDAIENSIPVLESYGFTAVFFIPTNFVGGKSSWMHSRVETDFSIAGWEKIQSLSSKGFEIGSHTMTHPYLTELSSEQCARELRGSRTILMEKLGSDIRHMAYPYGFFDERVRRIAQEEGYLTACTTEESRADMNKDLLTLPRINVGMEDSLLDFIFKIYTSTTPKRITSNEISRLKAIVPQPARKFIKKLMGYNSSN